MTEELTVGEIEDFLMHHGVKGMKWGHHTGGGGGVDRATRKAARVDASIARGQAKLDKNGGKAGKTYAKILGKNFVDNLATNIGTQSAARLTKNHVGVQAGITLVGSAVNMGLNIRDIRAIADVHRAVKANKAAGRAPGQGA